MIPDLCDDETSATPDADRDHAMPAWYRLLEAAFLVGVIACSALEPWAWFGPHP